MMRRPATLLLLAIVMLAVLAPVLSPYNPGATSDIVGLKNSLPSFAHPLGTDDISRDTLSRALYGARTSLLVAFLATFVAVFAGAVWGGVAASVGSRPGQLLMLVVDVFRSIPRLLLFLAAVALLGELTPVLLAMLLGAAAWPATARLVFAVVRDTGSRGFVEAARAAGASPTRVFVRQIVPHLGGPLAASGALLLADILALEAGLSFVGLGVRPPNASWGSMVQDALPYLSTAWWTAAVPCACLLVTVLSAAAVADGLHRKDRRVQAVVPPQ